MASKKVFDIVFKTKGTGKAGGDMKSLTGTIFSLTKGLAVAGAGLAAVSVKLAGDFSKSLREVGTLMGGVTKLQMKEMSKELRVLSQSSGLALSSLAKAKYDVVSAGFAGAADSAKILSATTRLAVGGVTSAANAADILTTALNAYGLSARSVNDVSDILFTTVKFGKTTMDELGASMGQVLPFARAAKLSLQDVGAVMASLTAGGIKTAEATTALRGALVALTSPADGARKAMEEAGIEVVRFNDGSLNILETVKQFEGMAPDAIRKFIPDVRAQLAISSLAQNIDALGDNLQNFTKRSGATETAFTGMMGEFNNQMLVMKNTSQSILIEVGQIIIDAILPSITKANEGMQKLGEIGWDVVAERIVENAGTIEAILVDAINILGQKMIIVGSKMSNKLPWWLGGLDNEEMLANISLAEKAIAIRIRSMDDQIALLKEAITAPPEFNWAPAFEGLDINEWLPDWGPIEVFEPDAADFALDMTDKFEAFGLTLAQAKIYADEVGLSMEDYAMSLEHAAKTAKGQEDADKSRMKQSQKSFEETAKAAALNASSAEDAAEKVVRAIFMEALARQINNIMATIPFPFNIAAAAGAAGLLTGLFDQGMSQVKKLSIAQFGMDEVVSSPTLVLAGEAGPERIQVTPSGRAGSGGGSGITVNFLGPVTSRDFVRDTIIPEFSRVTKLGLA